MSRGRIVLSLLILGIALLAGWKLWPSLPEAEIDPGVSLKLGNFLQPTGRGLRYPSSVAVTADGRIFVADSAGQRLVIFDREGTLVRTIEGMDYPVGIAIYGSGCWVTELGQGRLTLIDAAGKRLTSKIETPQPFWPTALCLDKQGRLYVVNKAKQEIECYEQGRLLWTFAGDTVTGRLSFPMGIAVKDNGQVLIADSGNSRLIAYQPATGLARVIDGGEQRWFSNPRGIAVDEQGKVYIADAMQNQVLILDENLQLSGQLEVPPELGGLFMPDGLAWTGQGLLVVDKGNHRLVEFVRQGGQG